MTILCWVLDILDGFAEALTALLVIADITNRGPFCRRCTRRYIRRTLYVRAALNLALYVLPYHHGSRWYSPVVLVALTVLWRDSDDDWRKKRKRLKAKTSEALDAIKERMGEMTPSPIPTPA